MVDYKELFLILCKRMAQNHEEYENINEELFEKMRDSGATPQELTEYVITMNSKKHLPPMKYQINKKEMFKHF